MAMKWMISFESSGICSVNNPYNAFPFPHINSLFRRGDFSKETYGTKQNVGYCQIGIIKCISYLYSACFKNDLKHIRCIHTLNYFPIFNYKNTSLSSYFSLFLRKKVHILSDKKMTELCIFIWSGKKQSQFSWIQFAVNCLKMHFSAHMKK